MNTVLRAYRELIEAGYLVVGSRVTAVASEDQWPEGWRPPVGLMLTPEEFVRKITGASTPESFVRLVERNDWQTVLVTMLHRALLDGAFEAGDRLPLSSELGEYLGVSKDTVVLAYRALSEAGYLVTVSG
ncbi:GntR family transcriptional regulator, partial [Nocardia paucivorans]|uniref:GntR family transcriptional regulator n=1 Tax=Nocardia paucivorans TaxID=114259 RepID=UPI0027E4E9FA